VAFDLPISGHSPVGIPLEQVSQWDLKGGSLSEVENGASMYADGHRDPAAYPWFALRVKSRAEKIVATMARHKGFEDFLPLYQTRRLWSDRYKTVELPLFPGYVFCRANPEFRLPLLTIPGVLNFVGFGRFPAPIDEAEMDAIKRAIGFGLQAEPYPFLEVGQRVRLAEGPLKGLEGFLVQVRNQQRIVVSVSLLRRSVVVEIDRDWGRPLDPKGREVSILIQRRFLAADATTHV
jgi:transcription antitermination factor NusG